MFTFVYIKLCVSFRMNFSFHSINFLVLSFHNVQNTVTFAQKTLFILLKALKFNNNSHLIKHLIPINEVFIIKYLLGLYYKNH